MRTPDPNAPTREKILDAAEKLMLAKGFGATSIEEICRKARAASGSFFYFFPTKESLGMAAVERFIAREIEALEVLPFRNDPNPAARVLGWIDAAAAAFANPALPRSCLLGNITQELAVTHSGFQSLCARLFTRWADGFVRDLQAVSNPNLSGAAARDLGELFMSLIQGSLVLTKAKRDASIGSKNMRHFRKYIQSLIGRQK